MQVLGQPGLHSGFHVSLSCRVRLRYTCCVHTYMQPNVCSHTIFLKPTEKSKELRSPPATGGHQVIPPILGIPNLSTASSD